MILLLAYYIQSTVPFTNMANRKPMWNNYSGYQTFYPEGLSYYGEDAHYKYYYQDQPTVSYNNFDPPNGYCQQNTNNKVPKGPIQNKPKDSVVDKTSLYTTPAVTTPVHNTCNFKKPIQQSYLKWTDQFWQKQNKDLESTTKQENIQQNVSKPANKIEKKLNEMLAQPVQMSKGKKMLEKMGWTGGGLGKDGDGIVEPITPKATYASQTMGLGLLTEVNEQLNSSTARKKQSKTNLPVKNKGNRRAQFSKKKGKKKIPKEPIDLDDAEDELHFTNYFRKNLLLKILEFVKNNKKIEIKFDTKLSKRERKKIHLVVQNVRECVDVHDLNYDDSEIEIVSDIMEHNNYELCTESTGKGTNRCLSLYKEAPDLVYITTPHYLREERDDSDSKDYEISLDDNKTVESSEKIVLTTDKTWNLNSNLLDNKTEINIDSVIDTDNEGNVTNNLNKLGDIKVNDNITPLKPELVVLKKIIDFFKVFANEPIYVYEEFRFLGSFNKREATAVKLFFDICMKINIEFEEANELLRILEHESYVFTVDFDCNGNLVVLKRERSKQVE